MIDRLNSRFFSPAFIINSHIMTGLPDAWTPWSFQQLLYEDVPGNMEPDFPELFTSHREPFTLQDDDTEGSDKQAVQRKV